MHLPKLKTFQEHDVLESKNMNGKQYQKHHKRKICIICTGNHPLKKELWPEWQNQSQKCNGKNHFATVCKKGQPCGGPNVRSSLTLTAMNVMIAFESKQSNIQLCKRNKHTTLNGFVNFLSKFLTRLAYQIEPIHCLTGQDTEFNWTEEQENAFREVKHLVITTPSPNTFTTRRLNLKSTVMPKA